MNCFKKEFIPSWHPLNISKTFSTNGFKQKVDSFLTSIQYSKCPFTIPKLTKKNTITTTNVQRNAQSKKFIPACSPLKYSISISNFQKNIAQRNMIVFEKEFPKKHNCFQKDPQRNIIVFKKHFPKKHYCFQKRNSQINMIVNEFL